MIDPRSRGFPRVVTLLVASALASGCFGGEGATEGDCNARIRFEEALYLPHTEPTADLRRGSRLGAGDIVGCGGLSADAVDRVTVHAVKGIDPDIAVMTRDPDWGPAIFVAEGLPPASWPSDLPR